MSWLGGLLRSPASDPAADAAAASRSAEWRAALEGQKLPAFVAKRLADAGAGRAPWLSTMSPAELLLSRSHGIRPVATVSGTCWQHYGFSWTNGHAEGWHAALDRIRREAVAAGANAIVDVALRTIKLRVGSSMDFTVFGTAVKIDRLPPSPDPVIATVPALEFVRLLEAGIVPTGVAIGAYYEWLRPTVLNPAGRMSFTNQPLADLSDLLNRVRRQALQALRDDGHRRGNGVLAHTHFSEVLHDERGGEGAPHYMARHIAIGTAVQCRPHDPAPHEIRPVIDMRDHLSPLCDAAPGGHNAGPVAGDAAGAI